MILIMRKLLTYLDKKFLLSSLSKNYCKMFFFNWLLTLFVVGRTKKRNLNFYISFIFFQWKYCNFIFIYIYFITKIKLITIKNSKEKIIIKKYTLWRRLCKINWVLSHCACGRYDFKLTYFMLLDADYLLSYLYI